MQFDYVVLTSKTMNNENKKKRFKLFIDRDVQGTLAKRFFFHWCSLGFCIFVLTAVVHVISNPFEAPETQWHAYWQQNGRIFILLGLLTPAFVWDSIKLSNRFAGPVSRLRRALENMANGEDVRELKFRRGDFWQDMAENFNRARQRLVDADQKTKNESTNVSEEADELVHQ